MESLKEQLLESSKLVSTQEVELRQAANREETLRDALQKSHEEISDLTREYQRSYSKLSDKASAENKALKSKVRELELENYKAQLRQAQQEEALHEANLKIKKMQLELQYIEKSHVEREQEKQRVVKLYRLAHERIDGHNGHIGTLAEKMRKSLQVEID